MLTKSIQIMQDRIIRARAAESSGLMNSSLYDVHRAKRLKKEKPVY